MKVLASGITIPRGIGPDAAEEAGDEGNAGEGA